MKELTMEPCDPRIYLAAERTFPAWIRTGIALMGFGFIAARFGIFLREEAATGHGMPQGIGVSLPLGATLIILGVVINLSAAVRHRRHLKALDRGEFRTAFGSSFALFVAGALVLVGLGAVSYLLLIEKVF